MKRFVVTLLITGVLLFGATGCQREAGDGTESPSRGQEMPAAPGQGPSDIPAGPAQPGQQPGNP